MISCTLVVVEGMGNLVHDVVGVFEEAKNTIVKFNAHIITILLQTERTEVEVFQPMIAYLSRQSSLL